MNGLSDVALQGINVLNNTNIKKMTTDGGIWFVLAVDSLVFLIGLFLFLVCWKRTALYQSKPYDASDVMDDVESRRMLSENSSIDDDYSSDGDELSSKRLSSGGDLTYLDRFVQWLFYTREYEIFSTKYGHEVGVYLYFSKQIILALAICTFLGLAVLLPIHLTGTAPDTKLEYAYGNFKYTSNDYFLLKTTVSMVTGEPRKMFAHLTLAIVFVLVILGFLHRFNASQFVKHYVFWNQARDLKNQFISNFAVQLSGLPRNLVDNQELKDALEELYPGKIFSARIALDMRTRLQLQKQLDHANLQIEHYVTKRLADNKNRDPTLLLCCGFATSQCCCGVGSSAVKYWENRRDSIQQQIDQWEEDFQIKPRGTGFAHVIFNSSKDAAICRRRGDEGNVLFRSRRLDFYVERAYEPEDLKWKNFSIGFSQRTLRIIGVHLVLLILLVFFTSPLSIVSTAQSFASQVPYFYKAMTKIHKLTGVAGDLVFQYLPTFSLFVLTLVIPLLIPMLTQFELYRSRSQELRVKLLRLFIYLLLSTLVLPSLLLTSLDGVINYLQKGEVFSALQNLFLPASGAFFINYTIQYTLLGDFVDLLRLKDFITFVYRRITAVTKREKEEALKVGDFDLAGEYAYLISFLAIILVYSTFSPLSLLVGLIYFVSKYLIDRHNITRLCNKNDKAQYRLTRDIFAYRQKTKLVTHLVMVNVLVFEIFMLLFFAKSGKELYPHLIVMVIFLMATFIYCIHWTISFDNAYRDVNDAMKRSHLTEKEERNILFNYCDSMKDVYFTPYALQMFPSLQRQVEEELQELEKLASEPELDYKGEYQNVHQQEEEEEEKQLQDLSENAEPLIQMDT